MKVCPTCRKTFEDDVRFCLNDGTVLVRMGESNQPTMTMPAQPAFQPPPPPTLVLPSQPSMSVAATLVNIFIAPARAFESFRDMATFSPAAVRVLVAVPIILVALVVYNALYLVQVGTETVARATFEASPRMANLPPEEKERALRMTQNPTYRVVTSAITLVRVVGLFLVSLPLGALIYWLGAMIFKARLKYMQALLVWTYAALPPAVVWIIANAVTLIVWPPSTISRLALGASGVFPGNLGWLFTVTTLPPPVHVVALSALDIFDFYGMTLAVVGLRKAGRLPWLGALAIVIFVWLIGVIWRISMAGLASAIMS